MLKHKYAVGDQVIVSSLTSNENIRPGVYTIVRLLPLARGHYQYRAKNELDRHERVFDENILRRSDV